MLNLLVAIVEGVPKAICWACWAAFFEDEPRVGGGVCICEESVALIAAAFGADAGLSI